MGRSSRKRHSTTQDQRSETLKKARNGVVEEDVASDEENDNPAKCEKGGKKSEKRKTKNRDSIKKKQTRPNKEASDQSDESSAESKSEDEEALSKIVEHPKASSSKDKQKNKKKQLSTDVQASEKGEVENIITHKQVKDKRKYLVKWKDSSRGETWETSQKVTGICLDLYRSYIAEQEKPDKVEAIISHKREKNRKLKYLIKWKDNSRGDTWEPAPKIASICPDLMRNYKAEVKKQNEVEAIISHRNVGGIKQYLIKWKDSDKKKTWEYPSKMALICPDLIKSYKAECEKRNEVEAISSHKKDKHFFMKYLIKWKDHSRGETWEKHKAILKICPKMLRDYTEKVEKAETNQIKAIIEHQIDHGRSKYLIKWNDKSKVESWETAKKTMAVGPDMLDIFVKMNPDCFPRISEPGRRYTFRTDSPKKKKQSKKSKTKGKESVDEEWDENEEWEVDRILDVWNKKDKSREFLVHWKGYGSKYDSWEPEKSLNCPDLIANYMVQLENAQNAVQKELRPLRKQVDRLVDRMTIKPKANDNNRSSKRHDGKMRAIYFDAEE